MRNFVFANVNDIDDAKVARSLTLHLEMMAPMAWKREAGRSLDHLVRGWLGLKASETKGVPKLKPKLMTAATKAVNQCCQMKMAQNRELSAKSRKKRRDCSKLGCIFLLHICMF